MNSSDRSPCEWASQQISELRDQGLDAAAAAILFDHLSECVRCREEADWDNRLGTVLCRMPLPAPSSALRQKVQRCLYWRRLRRVAFGAATAAMVGGVIVASQFGARLPRTSFFAPTGAPLESAAGNDLIESRMLFAAPPVDRLELLARQEAGFVAVLREALEEE
jgi:hypothetical protein